MPIPSAMYSKGLPPALSHVELEVYRRSTKPPPISVTPQANTKLRYQMGDKYELLAHTCQYLAFRVLPPLPRPEYEHVGIHYLNEPKHAPTPVKADSEVPAYKFLEPLSQPLKSGPSISSVCAID